MEEKVAPDTSQQGYNCEDNDSRGKEKQEDSKTMEHARFPVVIKIGLDLQVYFHGNC